MKTCANCGRLNDDNEKRCERCGCLVSEKETMNKNFSKVCKLCGKIISVNFKEICPYCNGELHDASLGFTSAQAAFLMLYFGRGR